MREVFFITPIEIEMGNAIKMCLNEMHGGVRVARICLTFFLLKCFETKKYFMTIAIHLYSIVCH